ncbi:unnamed protein product [Arctogadus glacialis]
MTGRDCSSPWFSWWSAALLFWGTTTVGSLVDQGLENPQVTTPGNYLIEGGANNTNEISNGESIVIRECGEKTQICQAYCEFCHGWDQMWCLSDLIDLQCHKPFRIHMDLHNSTNWCVWSNMRRQVNAASGCDAEHSFGAVSNKLSGTQCGEPSQAPSPPDEYHKEKKPRGDLKPVGLQRESATAHAERRHHGNEHTTSSARRE